MSAGVRASVETVVEAFAEHHEKRIEGIDALMSVGVLTNATVDTHHAWQKAEVARFDAWLVEAGWMRAELFEVLREVATEIKAERVDGKNGG